MEDELSGIDSGTTEVVQPQQELQEKHLAAVDNNLEEVSNEHEEERTMGSYGVAGEEEIMIIGLEDRELEIATEFEKWNINLVSGKRNSFTAVGVDGQIKTMRRRSDVVVFLSRNQHINLKVTDFVFKKIVRSVGSKMSESGLDVEDNNMEESGTLKDERKRINKEEDQISAKIKRVAEDKVCDHSEKFELVQKKLHAIRVTNAEIPKNLTVSTISDLKSIINDLSVEEDPVKLVKEFCKSPELLAAMKVVFDSKIETEIELSSISSEKTPVTMAFPPESDSNFYCSVVEEAASKMPNFLAFLVNILDSSETSLSPAYVIKLATLICELLNSKENQHLFNTDMQFC